MIEEYEYRAVAQVYVWAYLYLNNLGMEKGLAKIGGDERLFYIFDKRVDQSAMSLRREPKMIRHAQ